MQSNIKCEVSSNTEELNTCAPPCTASPPKRRPGQSYVQERENGQSKLKVIIFKIIKEKDAEYEIEEDDLVADAADSYSNLSHGSSRTEST